MEAHANQSLSIFGVFGMDGVEEDNKTILIFLQHSAKNNWHRSSAFCDSLFSASNRGLFCQSCNSEMHLMYGVFYSEILLFNVGSYCF